MKEVITMNQKQVQNLCSFIKACPSTFHTIHTIEHILQKEGFIPLIESKKWNLIRGNNYYVTRNGSSIIAFTVGNEVCEDYSFQICASHSDSPTFKLKEHAQLDVLGKYTQLNIEGYGGMIASSWMDRPLSIAGRALVNTKEGCAVKLVDFDRDMVLIPNVAIHMNRDINSGYKYNVQVDMLPLYSSISDNKATFQDILAKQLNVDQEAILGSDLYLYNRTPASIWGCDGEFMSMPKLDDLECAYTTLMGFLKSQQTHNVNVFACFDNEEVGSLSKQGAGSTLLKDTLTRINTGLGYDEETRLCAIAHSFLLSVDNAHALHPNHPEKSDKQNSVYMNEGVVIKFNANQKYTTDAISKGLFETICKRVNVPVQYFANRSDMTGGSTLGNVSNAQVSLHSVDIGLAQLAMHSSYETAGTRDVTYMMEAVQAFYNSYLMEDVDGTLTICM